MVDTSSRVGTRRPGGRAERVRTAVLAATFELLTERGYEGVAVEEVATRAGVHKTTVYRRWPTRPALVADAVAAHADAHVPVPDTGSLEGDLGAFARDVIATNATGVGATRARSLVAAAAASDELTSALHALWAERFAAASTIVERAAERGEIPPDLDPTIVIEAVVGPIWMRLLVTGAPIDEELADRLAALVAAGVTQRGPAAPARTSRTTSAPRS